MDGGGLLTGMPPWMRFILVAGPTTVIALFLVYQLTNERSLKLDEIRRNQESHASSMAAQATAFSFFATSHGSDTARIIALLRQLCMNTARNYEERRGCGE